MCSAYMQAAAAAAAEMNQDPNEVPRVVVRDDVRTQHCTCLSEMIEDPTLSSSFISATPGTFFRQKVALLNVFFASSGRAAR